MRRSVIHALVFAAMSTSAALAADKVILGTTPSISSAIVYVAKEQGFFAKHGLDVELVVPGTPALVPALASGSVHISTPTVTTSLQAIDNGIDLVFVAGENVVSHDHPEYRVLAGNGLVLNEPKDFIGKKVGTVALGAFLHVLFQEWLIKGGVDPASVTFVEVAFAQQSDLLKQGAIDAVLGVEPYMTGILQAGSGVLAADFVKDFPDGLPVLAFASTREWAEQNGELLTSFRAALDEANASIIADSEKAKADVNIALKLPENIIANIQIPRYEVAVDVEMLNVWIEMMSSQKYISNNVSAEDILME